MTAKERMAMPLEKWGHTDLRAYIRRRMKEEDISFYKLAAALGVSRTNLNNGMNGKFPVPLDRIEAILWMLDGEQGIMAGDFAKKVAEEISKISGK